MDSLLAKARWLENEDIRPYVFVRRENQIINPGTQHHLDWFSQKAIIKNPMDLDELNFANAIYYLEGKAFDKVGMAMPRWVFYDCGVIPGFVAGFAGRYSQLHPSIKDFLSPFKELKWVPLSLFIIIPTMHKGEWVAHNLCSINSQISTEGQLYGLGFLSKAFGLWYANVKQCSGVTQWGSPALKLHSYYGHMEILGAYAPIHSIAKTLTYRVEVNPQLWSLFFSRETDFSFLENYEKAGFTIDPKNELSMLSLQKKVEKQQGPFFLSASEIGSKSISDPLEVYKLKSFC